MRIEIKDFLSLLKPHERIIAMLYYEGFTSGEIAEIIDYHEKSVVRIFSEIKNKWRQYEVRGILHPEED